MIAAGHLNRAGMEWNERQLFVLGGTTEPERASQASSNSVIGLFTQDGNSPGNQRIQLTL